MGKLHEILAVEQGLAATAKKLSTESIKTFGKENLFTGRTTRMEMFDEGQSHLNTVETQVLETTVDENLEYLRDAIAEYWDAVLQKESANQHAVADLEIDGINVASNIPATFLLGLETKLKDLRQIYEAIPTLPPGKAWVEDKTERPGIFKDNNDETRFKTEKDVEFKIAAEATEHHPAQIVQLSRTNNVGKYTVVTKSGMLAPVDKAARIKRIDKLLRAVKKARQRANNVSVNDEKIGETLIDFINQG